MVFWKQRSTLARQWFWEPAGSSCTENGLAPLLESGLEDRSCCEAATFLSTHPFFLHAHRKKTHSVSPAHRFPPAHPPQPTVRATQHLPGPLRKASRFPLPPNSLSHPCPKPSGNRASSRPSACSSITVTNQRSKHPSGAPRSRKGARGSTTTRGGQQRAYFRP